MAKIEFNRKESRDEKVNFHYREFRLNNKLYRLSYCSGPSFLATGRTDQLFMEIEIIPKNQKENNEIYVLKRYYKKLENSVIQHISINKKTGKIQNIKNNKSLDEFLSSIIDIMGDLFNSYPNYERHRYMPLKKEGIPASDYDLMHMYFKHI